MGEVSTVIGSFVGRITELDAVDAALARASRGDGCLVLVGGEAGIGKTRFCREVAARARRDGFAVGWGSCWPEGGAPPLWPWRAILNDLADSAGRALAADDQGGARIDPERFARFAAIADRLAAISSGTPILLVIDDVHAADPGAVLLARFVARTLAHLPIALLLAGRPEGPTAGELGATVELTLSRFDLAEAAEFVRSRGHPEVPDALLRTLLRLTGGHPLHLQRVVAHGPADPSTRTAEEDVRAAIVAAVAGLTWPIREVLSRVAVLGAAPTVPDAAVVGDVPPATVRDALGAAEFAGLVTVDSPERFSFSHELVREVLVAQLTAEEELAAHARAAAVVSRSGAGDPDREARGAHHALRAAPRSAADARRAVDACRVAAEAMTAGFAYEEAESLLASAVAAHERAGLAEPAAPLMVEWAEAMLRCGRLAEARALFDRAAGLAMAEDDPIMLARAAVGLGGVWVNEHRTTLDWERVAGLQRRALAGLPAYQVALRHRLIVRLAAEEVYRGGPVEPVLAALEDARALGDGRVLAEALSLCHHALLTPRYTWVRLTLAEELIAVASPAGEGMLALIGLCWRAVDLFHLSDPRATRALAELRERADALGCLSVLYIAESMEVMLLIRAGRLDEAEAKAHDCFALGSRIGDADALGYLGAHLTTIRWLQDRDAEMLATIEQIADSPNLNPADFAFEATVASLAARTGRLDVARTVLARLIAPGLAALPQSSTWLAGMLAIVESARPLGDADLARQAYDLLTPYADLPVMPSLAVTCFGSVERLLGLAAATFGDPQRAVEHLRRALAANRLLGNRPVSAVTSADLAEALLVRGRPADHEQAVDHLTWARAEAEAIGLSTRTEAWSRRLRDITGRDATISRQRRHWTLTLGERQIVVPDRLGVQYLAHLLASPGQQVAALELAGGAVGSTAPVQAGQPVLDEQARVAYRRRADDLTRQLAEADRQGDPAQSQLLREELDALLDELRRSTGIGGRSRRFADPGERARTAVRKAIKRAIDEIADAEPEIGAVLRTTITTGASCSYTPDPGHPVRWAYTDDR